MQGRTQRIKTTPGKGDRSPATPTNLGKYEISGQIGEGGFGVVLQGFDPFIKRSVAIKTCTSPDRELRQRYFREAEIAGRLDHPNIVRIFDFGIEEDTPYLVQEFLAGCDLDHKMAGSEFVPYPERLLYLIHIARGLAYAHEQGIIHRDIKPANIRILEDGSAKIMDFGVAMLLHTDTRLTKDGMAVGTAAYLAPEQIEGKTTDRRTDVFSFGALTYELWTGQRPFEKDSISATLYSVLNDDPKPITMPEHVCPPAMQQLIDGCLEKDPDHRIGDFSEIIQELDQIRIQMRPKDDRRDFTLELRNVSSSTDPPRQRLPVDQKTSSQSFDPHLRHTSAPTSIRMQRHRSWRGVLVSATVFALLATGYAFLAGQGVVPWHDSEPEIAFPAKAEPTGTSEEPTTSVPPEADSKTAGLQAEVASVESNLEARDPDEPSEVTTRAHQDQLPTLEAELPSPPVIEKVTLYLARGWHDGITASIDGGEPIRLSRTRSLKLEPGTYTVRYSLVTAGYSDSRTVRVELSSGQERTLSSPLDRPGGLSVQASLGSPQGVVHVNGKSIGPSPQRSLSLKPGSHQLQVFAVNHPATPLVDTTFEIQSSRETVITFDLTGQRELAVRYREVTHQGGPE